MIRTLGQGKPETKNDYHRPQDAWVQQPLANDVDSDGAAGYRAMSLRSKRTMFTLAVTTFTVGALFIIGSSPYRHEFIAPGPLCSSHAQILAGQGADRCAACHGASDKTFATWLTDTFTGGRSIPVSQSQLCMECHEKSISPDHALNPHSVAVSELRGKTEQRQGSSFVSANLGVASLSSPPVNKHHEIACSACHREHHGNTSLTALTDQQCQTCHAQVYHSFETDHPEFTNWPQQRRSRIAFDHSTHAGKHFPGKSTEFNCNQCHVDGPHGNVKLLASFEQSCAACHDQQIQQSGESGLAVFSLPSIDTDAVERLSLRVGSWPMAATGDFDGAIPPAMRLLLHADPDAREALDRLGERYGDDFDFADVDAENAEQVADAVSLVWAIKRLLNDLAIGGQSAMGVRLSQATGQDVELDLVSELASELDEFVFRATIRRWLPGLGNELAEYRAGRLRASEQLVSLKQPKQEGRARFVPVAFSRQLASSGDVLVANPLADLFSGSAAESTKEQGSTNEVPMAVRTPDPVVSNESESASGAAQIPQSRQPLKLKNSLVTDLGSSSEWLAVNPLAAGADSVDPAAITAAKTSAPAMSADALEPAEADGWQVPAVTRPGWYRDDELFRIFYRPGGHADRCVKAWSDFAASASNANTRPETGPLFKQLLSDQSVGMCATCHTVDQLSDASFSVNWGAKYRDPSVGAFTKFSHQPHTLQPDLRDCSACHDMASPVSNKDSFLSHDPGEVVSNFAAITKMNCVNCHRAGGTNNGCTHCHSYHIGSVTPGQQPESDR